METTETSTAQAGGTDRERHWVSCPSAHRELNSHWLKGGKHGADLTPFEGGVFFPQSAPIWNTLLKSFKSALVSPGTEASLCHFLFLLGACWRWLWKNLQDKAQVLGICFQADWGPRARAAGRSARNYVSMKRHLALCFSRMWTNSLPAWKQQGLRPQPLSPECFSSSNMSWVHFYFTISGQFKMKTLMHALTPT